METNELDYFEKKYEKLLRSIPSVTIAVRVKPYIKILVEEEAKKRGFKISQYLNKIILNNLMSLATEEDQNLEIDRLGTISKSNENQNGELPNVRDLALKPFNEKGNMLSIEGLDIRDLIMKLCIRVEQLQKNTSEFDQQMRKHFRRLEAVLKAELRLQRLQKMKNKNDTLPN